jgi:hypothetical protein
MWHPALQMAEKDQSKPEHKRLTGQTVHALPSWLALSASWSHCSGIASAYVGFKALAVHTGWITGRCNNQPKTSKMHKRVKQSADCHPSQQERTQRAREYPMAWHLTDFMKTYPRGQCVRLAVPKRVKDNLSEIPTNPKCTQTRHLQIRTCRCPSSPPRRYVCWRRVDRDSHGCRHSRQVEHRSLPRIQRRR